MSTSTDYVEVEFLASKTEREMIDAYALDLGITPEAAASLLIHLGVAEIASDLGAASVEDVDPHEVAQYVADDMEGDDE